jgi:hypothetical protein
MNPPSKVTYYRLPILKCIACDVEISQQTQCGECHNCEIMFCGKCFMHRAKVHEEYTNTVSFDCPICLTVMFTDPNMVKTIELRRYDFW